MLYSLLLRILFLFDAESIHQFTMKMLSACCSIPFLQKALYRKFCLKAPELSRELWGLSFKNTIGLAAGFDKNARYLRALETLGFGFVETGTVTPLPQAGNPKKRLFRLPADKALINRMGFNNDGADRAAERIHAYRKKYSPEMIIGGNIGKNKVTPNEEAWQDYEKCFLALHDAVDYFVVNVSSPNTPGLRDLQKKEQLRKILTHLQQLNETKTIQRPILLKIAPDLTLEDLDDIAELALEIKLDGLVSANTTLSREGLKTHPQKVEQIGNGGLSGKPLLERSTQITAYLFKKTNGQIPIIASGGIFTGKDAKEKLEAGASLIQIYTGFIYEGPGIVRRIGEQVARSKKVMNDE